MNIKHILVRTQIFKFIDEIQKCPELLNDVHYLVERFKLDYVMLRGTLPPIIDKSLEDGFRILTAYVQVYLKEEILDEAVVRNIGAFSRFLDMAADQSGKIVNFSTIARETGVSGKTVKGYYQILKDTLIAIKLEP